MSSLFFSKKLIRSCNSLLLTSIVSFGALPLSPSAFAQTTTGSSNTGSSSICRGLFFTNTSGASLVNRATATYQESFNQTVLNTVASQIQTTPILQVLQEGEVIDLDSDANILRQIQTLGLRDTSGNTLANVGYLVDALESELVALGLDETTAETQSLAAIESFANTASQFPFETAIANVYQRVQQNLTTAQQTLVLGGLNQDVIGQILTQTHPDVLRRLGVPNDDVAAIASVMLTRVQAALAGSEASENFNTVSSNIQADLNSELAGRSYQDTVSTNVASLNTELTLLETSGSSSIQTGNTISFEYSLPNNTTNNIYDLRLPILSELQASGITGAGTLQTVSYQVIDENDQETGSGTITAETVDNTTFTLQPNSTAFFSATITLDEADTTGTTSVSFNLGGNCGSDQQEQSVTVSTSTQDLIDPFGEVRSCDGGLLSDYTGFRVSLFDTDANNPTFPLQGLTDLTLTEIPDDPNNDIPLGLEPNDENANPFFLTNADLGRYSFLFDVTKGQLDIGRTYVLLVSPPPGSAFLERRIRIEILSRVGDIVTYEARAIDGRPLGALTTETLADPFTAQGTLTVSDAASVGLQIFAFTLSNIEICEAEEIQLTKVGDRIAAEPGDTVLYRLNVRSLSSSAVNRLTIDDVLPTGLVFVENSVRAAFNDQPLDVTVNRNGRNVEFVLPADFQLETGENFDIVYAAQVTPDGIRGNGENLAFVEGNKTRTNTSIGDGPAIHRLRIEQGIVADCGTLIGRVFVDKNFDGHQQPGEPGIPNAVIFLEDGNRIMTDADGLYSVANVLPGYHTGTLDLESVPGYDLAPNRYFIAENGQSRVARMEPGGLARMNFAVTPAIDGEAQ